MVTKLHLGQKILKKGPCGRKRHVCGKNKMSGGKKKMYAAMKMFKSRGLW